MLIAVHCEDEKTIKQNIEKAKVTYGEDMVQKKISGITHL